MTLSEMAITALLSALAQAGYVIGAVVFLAYVGRGLVYARKAIGSALDGAADEIR
jgi:hypothetical protein